MVENSAKNCEYFLISGFNKKPIPYDLTELYNQGEEICIENIETTNDFFHYKEPIVDIQIVHLNSRTRLSKEYHVVERTHSNFYKADFNNKTASEGMFLCFRYGRDLPPITDIDVVNTKCKSDNEWTVIETTVNGHSANLHSPLSPLYIAYRRAESNDPVDSLVVTDICVIFANKFEASPPAYTTINVSIKKSPISHTINICYKKSVVKQHVLTFQPDVIYCISSNSTDTIVDVYNPDVNKSKLPDLLPEDIRNVANFCMPWGATLESWSSELLNPRPSFITFVLTNAQYDKLYGAALLFYEDFDRYNLSEEEHTKLGLEMDGSDNMKVFASKSICLLSRYPLFQTFNKVLSFLIDEDKRQRSEITCEPCLPLESFLAQFLYSVPFPTIDVPNILLQWDTNNSISIQRPTNPTFKLGTSEIFYNLVRMLNVEHIIQLFLYMLTEEKILLTSTCNSDLVGTAEALLSMIFPFKWSVVYIPFLYLGCIHIIQSPSPYVIGVDSRFFDYFLLPEDVYCIDLINKFIKTPNLTCKYLDYNNVLPRNILKTLRTGLSNCKTEVETLEKAMQMKKVTKDKIDDLSILRKKEVIGESIRQCFMKAVVLMFKDYQKYLLPQSNKQKNEELFDSKGFLKSIEKNSKPLYAAIFDTQLWNLFIQNRSYATEFDNSIAFFDRCILYAQRNDDNLDNMSSLHQTEGVIKSQRTLVFPPPCSIKDWRPDTSRTTFPQRLDSTLIQSSICEDYEEDSGVSGIRESDSSLKIHQHKTSESQINDFIIPVIQLRSKIILENHRDNTPSMKTTVLRRQVDEVMQARQLGKEAKRGLSHCWASHLLTSSYCLWYLCLPGFIGYIQDTPTINGTGLVDRILELAIEMIDSMVKYQLTLPDQVCIRILMLLVHQTDSSRLKVSNIGRRLHFNVFSYGLRNQILLEEDTELTSSPLSVKHSYGSVIIDSRRNSTSNNSITHKNGDTTVTKDTNFVFSESPVVLVNEVEIDNEEALPLCRTNETRIYPSLHKSTVNLCDIDIEDRHKFFDQAIADGLQLRHNTDDSYHIMGPDKSLNIIEYRPEITAGSESAIIKQRPVSEELSKLHASIFIAEEVSHDFEDGHNISSNQEPVPTDTHVVKPIIKSLTLSKKSRTSFRQLKKVANRSFRSVRGFVSKVTVDIMNVDQKSGLPISFIPWENNTRKMDTGSSVQKSSQQRLSLRHNEGSLESLRENSSNIHLKEPKIASVDRIWEKITGSLAAVKIPIGRYCHDEDPVFVEQLSSEECLLSLSVTMSNFSQCTNCHWIVYDNDIMNGWSYNDSDLRCVCPYCNKTYIPIIVFKVFVNQHNLDQHNLKSNILYSKLAYKSQIIYLSPFVLRKELETVLQQKGDIVILEHNFIAKHSILYWNLMFYYFRLSLPSHMWSYVALWLRDNGRRLTSIGKDISNCEILTNLTGHEEVYVTFLLEMEDQDREILNPLYRMYYNQSLTHSFGEVISSQYSSSISQLDIVANALFNCDIGEAIVSMLKLRYSRIDEIVTCKRSVYRELMHLAILVLGKDNLDLDTFHKSYKSEWKIIAKAQSSIIDSYERPMSDSAFYCYRVFRPPQLI